MRVRLADAHVFTTHCACARHTTNACGPRFERVCVYSKHVRVTSNACTCMTRACILHTCPFHGSLCNLYSRLLAYESARACIYNVHTCIHVRVYMVLCIVCMHIHVKGVWLIMVARAYYAWFTHTHAITRFCMYMYHYTPLCVCTCASARCVRLLLCTHAFVPLHTFACHFSRMFHVSVTNT